MEKCTVKIMNSMGLHARPAMLLVKLLNQYESKVQVYKNDVMEEIYDAKNIMSIFSIGAVFGDELTFQSQGADEKKVLKAVELFFNNNCGE